MFSLDVLPYVVLAPDLCWGSVPIALVIAHAQGNVRGSKPSSTTDDWKETEWISALTGE